jgi:YVTN family beta-propeller protein
VIDAASNKIVAETEVGRRPWNMGLAPGGRKLYVACGRSNAVAVVDTATYAKSAEIAVGNLPWGIAFSAP